MRLRQKIAEKKKEAEKFLLLKGIEPAALPKAIAIHEFLGLAMLALTWSLAYKFPPSSNPFLAGPVKRINAMVPQRLSFLSSKAGSSYIEASCCRKLIRPLTIPGKLYITFIIMSGLDGFEMHRDETISKYRAAFMSQPKFTASF